MTLIKNLIGDPARRPRSCDHSGLHSPMARYSRDQAEIRYVTVCDGCGAETAELQRERYVPNFDPSGNDPYLNGAVAI